MARQLDLSKPLSADDVAHLRARHPESYVQRMIELAGGMEKADETVSGTSTTQSGSEAGEGASEADEDLIGATPGNGGTSYNPADHTVDEVTKHLKTVSDEEKAAIIALEREGRGRTSITG